MKHSLEERIQLHKDLLASDDDIRLFTQGGCHVFALALHERFNYAIRLIPGRCADSIAHIYCQVPGPPAFAVDVVGFTPEDNRVWNDFSGLSTHAIDREGLLRVC